MATEVETKEPISESPSDGAATAIDNSSISNETAKDEALCTVAVGTLDSSKGESLVERPKETVSKPAEIVSEKHKNEGDLTSKGNTGAKGEKVVAAKELAESDSSDVNVMAMDKERATDESASQNRLQQKDQDQDDNIVHAQATKFDLVEASEAQAEHKEDEGTTDIEKLEDNGDNIKKEVENVMLSDETTNGIYNTPAAEPFEKNNSKEPLEITNEDREPADKFESPTGAVLEEPDVEKFERVDEGEHVKVEAETGICNDERTNVIDCISVAEPSEEGSTQESLEKTSKEELEPAKGEHEHDKSESFQEPEEEKLKRVNEDDIKIEAETEICADKKIVDADSMSVAEPSDMEIEQEPPETTAKEGPEPAKEEPEHGKLETSHDAIPDEPDEKDLQRVNEDMNVKAEAENGTRDDERTKEFEPEHEKLEKYLDAVTGEPEEEHERVIKYKKIKMKAETEICADERTTDADSTSVAKPSENENREEPIKITVKEAHEPAEDVPEHHECESTLDAVLEKPEVSMLPDNGPESCRPNRNHENETMSKENLVMTLDECSLENDKEYEPIEKEALNLLPGYQSTFVGAAAATDNSSISRETAKDEALCTVAVGTLDSSEGEIIVEAPKETVLKYVEIVSGELKSEGDLTRNGDNTEAKDEKDTAAKEHAESESSDMNVMDIDKERAIDESASQDSLHQKDQDDNIVHAQTKKFDMVEASEGQAEDKEDDGATDIEKLEVNGDNIKKEAENGMLSDESTNGNDNNTPAAEPLENKNSKEPHEIMNKDLEPAHKLESPIDAVPEEPNVEKHAKVNEDEHVKVGAETEIFNDERTNGIDFISVEEPSQKGNTQKSLEKTSKEELEATDDEMEHDKLKSFLEPEEEKLGRVNEDNVKIEGEPEICADERIDDADSMSVAEPSDKEIKQVPLEVTAKEDPEPAKDEPEHGNLESSLDPVAHELEDKKLERINEDMNVKVEAENGICDDKRTNGIDSISAAEPSDKKNRQGPLEMTAKENLEPEKDKPEHEELEKSLDAVTEEHEEKLERVIEDKKIKMEAEIEICDEERTADADSTPMLEPSENENRQELIEITAKEALEPAEDVPEHSEPESSLDAVLQKPEASMLPDNGPESSGLNRNHENETMSKEDLVMTLEVCSLEDEKKYEPVEKEAVNFLPEYENSMTELGTETATANGTVTASKLNEKNEEDTVDDFTVTQEIILKTIEGVEMHETTISEALIHAADDNIEQIGRETEAENLNKISETTLEDRSNNKIADAETTNFISDDGANQKKELDTLCTAKVSVEENIENVIYAEKSTEQRSEKVDDNESNERCTQGTHELETEYAIHESIEDKDNIDSFFKAGQTSKKTTGVSLSTEQMGNEKVNEGSEVNQQKDPSKEVVDGVIRSDESSTEQGPNHDPKEDSGDDHLKIDTIRCEKIIITEHNAFADDIEEKNHVEKQENFKKMDEVASVLEGTTASADKPSCKADDKDEEKYNDKVRDDDNRNDGGEKLEEASNLLCENQAHETINSEGNIEVSNSNEKASEEFELVSELVPELKSQETRTETEGTQIEKSNFDENSSDKNIKTSNLTEETEPANEESGDSNTNYVLEETIDEDNQEGNITSFEELDESGIKKNTMVDGSGNDTEAANGEKESSREHNVVKGTTYGGSEIHEGATVGMGFRKEQKMTEKLDRNNELEQGKELSVAIEENAVDENLISVVQKENWAENLEGPSKVVSGKTIVDEESTFIQEGEKEDLSEKGEVVIHGQAVSRMDTEDQNSKPDGGNSENIHVGNDKPEEIPNSACEEQPRETINGSIGIEVDGEERELSQKLELVSSSVAEDKNQDIIRQKDFNVSTNDCILQNMNSEMVEKNDDKENTEANLNKALDDCCDSHVSIEETVNNEVGQKKEEGSSSANEDQNYQATDTTDKLEVFVSEEKETQHNIFQVSLPEDSCQETGESNAMKIDYSTNDEDPKTMMPGAADLNKDTETAKEKGEENLNTAKEDCSDDHTTIAPILHTSLAPILPDQIGEHENSSKTDYGEQIYLVINDECSIEVDIHKETADPEELENITESIPKDHNQGDVNEPKSTDNSDNTYHLDKVIPEITAHSDDPETAKVKDEDVLEKDFSYKCDDQELAPVATDCEDNKEASVKEGKENLDINMELGPEDLRQDVICETESVKVEKELNIDENEKCSAVRTEYTTDATSGVKLEETSVGDSYELESDDKQENTNMFEIREEEMPKEEETAGHIQEKTLGTVNTNTTEDISENQIEREDGANNANSEIIGCEQNQATEEEIPEVANRDQHKESYDGDDSTKNGTTSEKVKVSDTADVAKNLTETVEVQISEDASQVMKVDANEYQDYEENVECKENTNTSQMLGKSVTNENEEKTNEIHGDLVVTSTPSDEATYRNLHKNEGEKATKEVYGTGDGIPNQKANESEDGELKDKGSITISNNNVSDIPALDEETGQVENAHQKAANSSCDEQIHESISISEGANLDALNIENKNEQKSYESNGASESNENVSFKENTENDSEKEKLEDPEPEKSTHAVVEDLEITTGAEGIRESETNNESTKNNNEENFLKDGDMKLVESATELEPDQQSNKSIYPTEGASPSEETLNVKDLVDDVAKVEAHNEERHCRDDDVSITHNLVEESTDMESLAHNQVEESTDMEGEEPHLQKQSMELEAHGKTEQNDSIVAQNEEIAERSETLKLHKDTRELIEQSSNTLFGSQEIATPIENIEKNIMPDEEAAAADLEQIPDNETDAKENSELVTDTVPNDEVKEDNHKTSKELVMDSTQNLITSANTASQAEETKQEIGEQFSKISDYWPRAYNEEASMVNTVDAEHPKETVSVVEQPEAEQITHTSTDSTAACEIEEQGGEVYVPEDSGLDTIYKEGREELKEVSDSMPKEVDKKIGSSVELTEDRENPHEESAVQEPQEDQPDVVTETEELTDKAGHEVERHNLQEEKQQTGLGELLVSQFLTKYILQEEGDALNEACDGEYEDVSNKQNDGDKQNGGKIPKQEDISAPLSVVQLTEEGSTPEDKVGSEKLADSSESVQAQEGYERNENSDITLFKDGPSLQNTLDESTSSLVVTEDGKNEVDTLSSEMSNNIARDESMEVNSTEQNSQGSTVDNEHCKPDLVQDEKIKGTVFEETLTQEEIQKDNETLDKEVDVSTFGETSEEDNLQKEKECLQDVVKAEGSYEVSDGQSTMDDSEYGENLEIKSEIEKVDDGDEKQEVGNQVQILKNGSTEELTLSEPQISQQTDLVNEAKIHARETAEKFMADKNSAITLDRKQIMEGKVDENKADEEKHEKEEKEEFKPEKSSSNAAIVETKESELKPIQKCEQTRKSSESSTTEDHELEETLQLHSEVQIVESGEKKQDAVNQNQVQMKNGLNEEENLSDSAIQPLHMAEKLEEQSSVANVDEKHAVQTTETKVDENKAGDEKDEKEEEEEEEEKDEHDPEESGQNSTINVEARDAELKPTPKRSHGLLSGVGSKVKHSIAKVKKAITGKSSHSKKVSAK